MWIKPNRSLEFKDGLKLKMIEWLDGKGISLCN